MTPTLSTPSTSIGYPTRFTRFLVAIAPALLHVGCTIFNGTNPCDPETGEVGGWVFYHDGLYIDIESRPYAMPGDRPFDACTVILGNISLKGEITDFSDFDHIESIPGFFDNGSILEPAPLEGSSCGVIRGFPALKRITWKVEDHGSNVENPTTCYYLDGFENLEYVGTDFTCRGSDNLGTELIEVGGRLTCPEDRLQKLERVGEYILTDGHLPSLRWAGRISAFPIESIDLPLLQQVGPYLRPNEPVNSDLSALIISQPAMRRMNLPMLQLVDARLEVNAVGRLHPEIFIEGHAEVVRSYFNDVEVTGRRIICQNDPTDPCPNDDDCEDVYGEGSLECCGFPWPTCLEMVGGAE